MVATIPGSPFSTTNAAGSFASTSQGETQGTFYDDPAVRFALAGGILSTLETIPMWGGVGVYAQVPTPQGSPPITPSAALGVILGRATTLTQTSATGLTGFSVFNQAHNMVISPGSTVPLSGSGMMVNYFPLGSGARIAVACAPSLVSLDGGSIGQQVSWDFNNQVLQPYDAATATYAITSLTWSATNGGQVAVVMGVASPVVAVGDFINISGVTSNSGTGGITLLNGNHVVNTFTDNQHFTFLLPGTSSIWGTIGLTSGVLNYGTAALACRVLRVSSGNSLTVNYNAAAVTATWNPSGTTAVIQI